MSREGGHTTPIDAHPQDSQKNHEEIIATYRNHLLSAAQVSTGGGRDRVGKGVWDLDPFSVRCSSARSLDVLRYGNVRGGGCLSPLFNSCPTVKPLCSVPYALPQFPPPSPRERRWGWACSSNRNNSYKGWNTYCIRQLCARFRVGSLTAVLKSKHHCFP